MGDYVIISVLHTGWIFLVEEKPSHNVKFASQPKDQAGPSVDPVERGVEKVL